MGYEIAFQDNTGLKKCKRLLCGFMLASEEQNHLIRELFSMSKRVVNILEDMIIFAKDNFKKHEKLYLYFQISIRNKYNKNQ